MIAQQNKEKYRKLDELFKEMHKEVKVRKVSNAFLHSKYAATIEKLIFKAFKLKVNLNLMDSPNPAYCMPSPVVGSNTFIDSDIRNMLKDSTGSEHTNKKAAQVLKLLSKNPGKINTKKAEVGGGFSKIPHLVVVDYKVFANRVGLKYDEILSVMFHELAHLFTFLENAYRVNSTNLFMLEVSTSLKNEGKDFNMKETTHKIKMQADKHGIDEDVLKDVAASDSRTMYGLQVARMMGDIAESDIGSAGLDNLESERVADAWTARLGYGKSLMMALVKIKNIGVEYDASGTRVQRAKLRTTKWSLVSFLLSIGTIVFLIPVYIVVAALILVYTIVRAFMEGMLYLLSAGRIINHSEGDEEYDDIKDRANKIYRNTIKLLKDSNIDKQEKSLIVTDLVYMKAVLDDLDKAEVPTSMYKDFAMILKYPLRTPAVKSKLNDYMNKIEELSANDLYLASAQLST